MPNSSPIDRREEVGQCDRQAAAIIIRAIRQQIGDTVLVHAPADDRVLIQTLAAHRLAERERCAGIDTNRLAEVIYHAVGFSSDLATIPPAPSWVEKALKEDHLGDCNGAPCSCMRCDAEECVRIAEYVGSHIATAIRSPNP